MTSYVRIRIGDRMKAKSWEYGGLHQPLQCQPCAVCNRLISDRSRAKKPIIETEYDLFDTFPDFPVLKASARAGCALCRLSNLD
ncbi:hypothetical protein F4818DRAFT_70727 [Hypoxylon cercidicola]|nr:hypothetical protein F4818DRAFT_70727 [Hypoxylon cercidicola]